MYFWETVYMAWETLVGNKLRSSLTMLGIIIGNTSVIAMVGIGQGGQRLAAEQFEALGPNTLFVFPGTQETRRTTFNLPKTLVLADANAIKELVPSVAEVAPQINSRHIITYRNKNIKTEVIGTNSRFPKVRSLYLDTGRFITPFDLNRNSRIAVIGSDLAEKLFEQEEPIGQRIRIKNVSFEIVGVLKPKGYFLGISLDDTVFLPITTMSSQIVGSSSPYGIEISMISLSAKDERSISFAKFQIENLLRLRHQITGEDDFGVETQKDVVNVVGTVTSGLTIMLAAIAAVSLVVGGIGIMNIMLISITERTQ